MKTTWDRTIKTALLSAVVGLTAAAPAQAAYYLPTLDPDYGGSFANLGWRASGTLYVPDACEAAVGVGAVTFDSTTAGGYDTSCTASALQNVTLTFYDIAFPLVAVETFNLGNFLLTAVNTTTEDDVTQELLSVSYLGGDAVGLSTSLSVPTQAFSSIAGGGASYFSLNFSSITGRLVEFSSAAATSFAQAESVSAKPADFGISRIPEPGTLALVLGVVGAGLARRLRPR